MAVKILKREYKNQFYPSDNNTNWLLGNVGDWQRVEITFEASVSFDGTDSDTISIDSINKTIKLNNGKSWQSYGFDLEDSCNIKYIVMTDTNGSGNYVKNNVSLNFVISNIYGDTIEYSENLNFGDYSIMPTDRGTVKITNLSITSVKEPEGLKFKYGHLTNDDYNNSNLASLVDGSYTEFSFAGLQNLPFGVYGNMIPNELQSGMAIKQCRVQKLGSIDVVEAEFNSGTYKARIFTEKTNNTQGSNIGSLIIGLAYKGAVNDSYKTVPVTYLPINYNMSDFGSYSSIDATMSFFINKNVSENRIFDLDFRFRITGTNDNSNADTVSLICYRYSRTKQFVDKKVLKTWDNANDLVNKVLTYDDSFSLFCSQNEALVIGLEYYHKAENIKRYIDIEVLYTKLNSLAPVVQSDKNIYKVICDFMLGYFFDDSNDIRNGLAPGYLFNSGSLTDNFEIQVFPEWNNPNTSIRNDLKHTERLGNTGWFNENFNGLENPYKVKDVVYKDIDGNVISSLDYSKPVIFECVIESKNQISNDSRLGFGFSWLPNDDSYYKNKKTPYHKNLLVNTGKTYTDGCFSLNENNNGLLYKGNSFDDEVTMDLTDNGKPFFTRLSSNQIKCEIKFVPSSGFFNYFENNDQKDYFIFVSIANDEPLINFSDRVSLLASFGEMVKNIPSLGALKSLNTRFLEHPQNENAKGVITYFGHLEDDLLTKSTFNFESTKRIIGINFGFDIENILTSTIFKLSEYAVNLIDFAPNKNGIQEIEYFNTRGYKMSESNNKNWVRITRNQELDEGNRIGYTTFFAQKIRWEDWIFKNEVPEEFYNSKVVNNGYNNNWLNYLRNGDNYRLNYFIEIVFNDNGEVQMYKNKSEIKINGYDENTNIQTVHNYYRYSDEALINESERNGIILNNEKTLVEIIYENLNDNFDISKMYATISIEVENGIGEKEIRTISSVNVSEPDNPLESIDGNNLLTFYELSPSILVTRCLLNPELLPEANRFKISGRIGCFKEGSIEPEDFGIYEKYYENVYE